MNLDILFKIIVAAETLIALSLIVFELKTIRRHWRTTLAGVFVIVVVWALNALHFYRTGRFENTIALAEFLAVGIAFLLSADSHATPIQ